MTLAMAVLSGLLAAVATLCLLRFRARLPQAIPNARSLHPAPVPRVGGLALWAGWLPVVLLGPDVPGMAAAGWLPPWILLVLVSLRDDWQSLPIEHRLLAHAAAAAWVGVWLGASTGAMGMAQAGLVIGFAAVAGWSLNLYNFMDGSDGLAALAGVIGFGAYGAVAQHAGFNPTVFYALGAAAVPLFIANRPPARIFMGDVGAVPLGFLAAAFGLAGSHADLWEWWFPLLVFLPFVADATTTLVRRALRGERIWEAHKSHYYQRLHQLGAGHRGTLAVYGALMAGTGMTAVGCATIDPRLGPPAFLAWCTVCAVVFASIDYHWRKHITASPR